MDRLLIDIPFIIIVTHYRVCVCECVCVCVCVCVCGLILCYCCNCAVSYVHKLLSIELLHCHGNVSIRSGYGVGKISKCPK